MEPDQRPRVRTLVLDHLAELKIEYELLEIDPALSDTASFCAHYDFPTENAANAILLATKKKPVRFCLCVVLGHTRLDANGAARKLMESRVSFARTEDMVAQTGMEVGAVTPFGVRGIPVYVDGRVMTKDWIILGAGERSAKLKLSPTQLRRLETVKVVADLSL